VSTDHVGTIRQGRVAMIENIAHPTPDVIARMQAEATASNGWLVIEDTARRIFLLAGNTIRCHDDDFEFTDDDGEHVTLAYDEIALIENGSN
jgi:hypothetical protein